MSKYKRPNLYNSPPIRCTFHYLCPFNSSLDQANLFCNSFAYAANSDISASFAGQPTIKPVSLSLFGIK